MALAAHGYAPRATGLGRVSVLVHPLLRTRRQDDDTVLGLMDRRGDGVPFLFRLRREG